MLDLAVAVWILREKHPPCQPRFWLQLHLLCNSDWGACAQYSATEIEIAFHFLK